MTNTSLAPPAEGFLEAYLPQLCLELAANLEPPLNILQRYGVSNTRFQQLKSSPMFRKMIEEASAKFHSLANTADRVQIKAQLLMELDLPIMHDIVNDDNLQASARVSAFGAIRALSGLEKPKEATPGAHFELRIILPGNPEPITIEGDYDPPNPTYDPPNPTYDPKPVFLQELEPSE